MVKKFKIPHTYVILFAIIIVAGMLTWIVPEGTFDRQTTFVNGIEREIVKADSFHHC